MTIPSPRGGHPPDVLLEKFFDRQLRETMDRIAALEHRRRARQVVLPVAAALLLCAALLGGFALRGPSQPADDVDWLFAWSLPSDQGAEDPLAAFAPWSENAFAEADENGDSLLPPAPLDLGSAETVAGAATADDV